MLKIELIDITSDNWINICCLNPGKEGKEFVASNSFSLAQSFYEKGWITKGIVKDNQLIGFTMFGYSEEMKAYELCRFMIDQKFQGLGYGKEALKVILKFMFNCFHCTEIFLSTAPNNNRGKHIYEKIGFVSTGESCGEGDDVEDIYCLNAIQYELSEIVS